MKSLYKKALLLSASIALISCASQKYEEPTIGTGLNEVKFQETKLLQAESSNHLSYLGDMSGLQTKTDYYFHNDKISLISFCLNENLKNSEIYLMFYDVSTNTLTDHFGKPTISEFWEGEIYADIYDHPELWGKAVGKGYLSLLSEWHIDDKDIYSFMYPSTMQKIEDYKDLPIASCFIIKDAGLRIENAPSIYKDTINIKRRYKVDEK